MNLQWYPGHMTKTRRQIAEELKGIDVVMEVTDARAPASSRNPDFDVLFAAKPRVMVMNKADLADPAVTAAWEKWYIGQGWGVLSVNALSGSGVEKIADAARAAVADKLRRDKARGVSRPVRIMIVGIPNAGKSSLINRLCGRASAKTGDKPGVTRGKQWIKLKNGIELLDTPGILWPKFENQRDALNLAFIGSIKDEIMDTEELACHLLEFLCQAYPKQLADRYKLDDISNRSGFEVLQDVGRIRGFVVSGGEIDTLRAANILLNEFRAGRIGRITLEQPCKTV